MGPLGNGAWTASWLAVCAQSFTSTCQPNQQRNCLASLEHAPLPPGRSQAARRRAGILGKKVRLGIPQG
eukprot:9119716-Lingulodinium_polyedra.AAC.1